MFIFTREDCVEEGGFDFFDRSDVTQNGSVVKYLSHACFECFMRFCVCLIVIGNMPL